MKRDQYFDSNVVVYLLDGAGPKCERSEDLLEDGGTISVQVLNEVVNVMRRKTPRTWPEITDFLAGVRQSVVVIPLEVEAHEKAMRYAERYQLSIYDANIVAAAILAGCQILWSEDMHDGLVIDGLTIRNPYL